MRLLSTAILAGAAAVAIASANLPAAPQRQTPPPRLMTLMLPGGQLVQVQYAGDAAPQPAPLFTTMRQPDPVFAAMARMSAMMDRQAGAMLRQAAQISGFPAMRMAPSGMSAGGQFYSVSTSFSSMGGCTHSTEISYGGNGLAPRVVSASSGDCGAGQGAGQIEEQHQAAPMYQLGPDQGGAKPITVSGADAYKRMIRPAVLMSR